jgi:hypothetical protein
MGVFKSAVSFLSTMARVSKKQREKDRYLPGYSFVVYFSLDSDVRFLLSPP